MLDVDPIAHAAQAVLDAAPEHRGRRLVALLELLPVADGHHRKDASGK